MDIKLTGRKALITGGSKGLGLAIARTFAEAGADVAIMARRQGPLDEAIAAIGSRRGQQALAVTCDVRRAEDIAAGFTRVTQAFGHIDILVNNAGAPAGPDRAAVVDLSEEAWDLVVGINLKGTFLCSRAVARTMLERRVRGRIVNISSQWGKVGGARRAAYCASKFGVIGLTQSLAQELAPAGITVNAVCPGAADTERLDHLGRRPDGSFDPALRAQRITEQSAAVPLGRIALPSDVAEVIAFLAGDGAEYITGQAINVAGGSVMH
jgi:NAD(P)-dependent dehydrogenase (short-subunit alcohol dehydrogenase family)